MTAPLISNRLRYEIGGGYNWPTATGVKGLFVAKSTWTPASADATLAAIFLAGAVEAAATLNRVTIGGKTRSQDDPNNRALWLGNGFSYAGIGNGTAFDTFILYQSVTSDSDAWPLAFYDVGSQTGTGKAFSVIVPYYIKW